MKTIKEWLNELPEPYRTQALKNYNPVFAADYPTFPETLNRAIYSAFLWSVTPEGGAYWADVHTRANNGTLDYMPSTPECPTPAPAYKPFDLEAAKAGKPVMMRDGTPIKRILAFDFDFAGYPIAATFTDCNGNEHMAYRTINGEANLHGACDPAGSALDLVMAPEAPKTVTKWVNAYKNQDGVIVGSLRLYDTEVRALEAPGRDHKSYIGTFPVEITL